MKKIFLAALAVAALASCGNDNEDAVVVTGEKARLNVTVTSPDNLRAADAIVATDVVNDFTVFITDQTGEIKWKGFSYNGADLTGTNAIEVTTQAKNVYVVANSGDLRSDISNMSDLNNYLADLNATGSQAAMRWATGSTATPLSFTQGVGNNFEATAEVDLHFIAARITLKINNGMTGYDALANDGSLVLKSVAVLNARGQSKLFGASLIPSPYSQYKKFYTGIENDNFTYFPAVGDYTYNADTKALLSDDGIDFAKTYYYYVFENDAELASAFPTIITIVGEYNNNPIYYPVHLAPYEQFLSGSIATTAGNPIKRGHSYQITVNLTVDPTFNGGDPGGTVDPTEPIVSADVSVDIELVDWIPVSLTKEF